jgi:hypothetical protein
VTRLFESVRVSVLEGQVPTLPFARPLLLEILLRHHVQVSVRRQPCSRRCFLSRLFPDCINGPLLGRSAVSRALSVERRHATSHERHRSHHYKKRTGLNCLAMLQGDNHVRFLVATFNVLTVNNGEALPCRALPAGSSLSVFSLRPLLV